MVYISGFCLQAHNQCVLELKMKGKKKEWWDKFPTPLKRWLPELKAL